MAINFEQFEQQVFLNTVLIHNLDDQEFGTGFLLQKKVSETQTKHLLFSNKHVFWGKKDKNNPICKKTIKITVHTQESGKTFGVTKIFNIPIERGQAGYWEHPDPEVDVACLNISELYNLAALSMRSADQSFFDLNLDEVPCGDRIVFIGYPKGFFDKQNFLPIMRTGFIASIPAVDFNGKKQILIDAEVFPGSSGSPVFVSHKGQYKLLGIVSEAAIDGLDYVKIDNAIDSSTPAPAKSFPVQFLGIGIVFKSSAIKEVYDVT